MANNDAMSSANRSKWLQSIESYVTITKETSLSLGANFGIEEIKAILRLLPNSQIRELNIGSNNLNGKLQDLLEILAQTDVRSLNLSECQLSVDDFVNLMKILKDTRVSDLSVSGNRIVLDDNAANELISNLPESRLTALNVDDNALFSQNKYAVLFVGKLIRSSITHLSLSSLFRDLESHCAIVALFSSLKHSAIKVLNLSFNAINSEDLKDLGASLRDSKLQGLDLSFNKIDDAAVNFLFEALEHSEVTDLSLKGNEISGSNSLGRRIKNTKVRILDLSGNRLRQTEMFAFPDFLRGSSVESLNLYNCSLSDETAERIMGSLPFSKVATLNLDSNRLGSDSLSKLIEIDCANLVSIDLSYNRVHRGGILAFGDCLKRSKLKCVTLAWIQAWSRNDISLPLAAFLEKTKGSHLVSVDLSLNKLQQGASKNIASSLENTTFTHFDLSQNDLKGGVINLATCLKFTCITHLKLSDNEIDDEGAKALANCIKETQIVELNIGKNSITSCGAAAVAYALKDSKVLRLILSRNKIENDGLEVLAEQVKHSLITVLDTEHNPGNRSMLIDTVLWENRTSVQRLLTAFKRITLKSDDGNLYFDQNIDGVDLSVFLEDCLFLYKSITQGPSALNVLEEDKIYFSGGQIMRLMVEKFPQQFSDFIGRSVYAEVIEHVNFLKKVENLGLSKVVECLLLNRPLYTIDEAQGVLHPYVYPLLLKYKQPICNLAVEPQAKNKLMQYFSENIHLAGAPDVVHLLSGQRIPVNVD